MSVSAIDTAADRTSAIDAGVAGARKAARVDLAAAFRLAALYGYHEAIDNHFTLMVPGAPTTYLLNPFGLHWSEIRASDFVEVDLAGNVVAGDGFADRSATCIHGPVHERGHACVLHTHMPYATAITQLADMTIEMIGQNAFGFYGRIAYDYDYGGLALDRKEGERLADALGDATVLMMANHGVLVCGETVAEAFNTLYFLEQTCRTQVLAMSTGLPRRYLPDARAAAAAKQFEDEDRVKQVAYARHSGLAEAVMTGADMHFAALKRMLDRLDTSYRD